jgi:hypothetical protein
LEASLAESRMATYEAIRIIGVKVADLFREIENMKQHPKQCNSCAICKEEAMADEFG